jgi:hypothetical protein
LSRSCHLFLARILKTQETGDFSRFCGSRKPIESSPSKRGHPPSNLFSYASWLTFWPAIGSVVARYWPAFGSVVARFWLSRGPLLAQSWPAFGPVLAHFVLLRPFFCAFYDARGPSSHRRRAIMSRKGVLAHGLQVCGVELGDFQISMHIYTICSSINTNTDERDEIGHCPAHRGGHLACRGRVFSRSASGRLIPHYALIPSFRERARVRAGAAGWTSGSVTHKLDGLGGILRLGSSGPRESSHPEYCITLLLYIYINAYFWIFRHILCRFCKDFFRRSP